MSIALFLACGLVFASQTAPTPERTDPAPGTLETTPADTTPGTLEGTVRVVGKPGQPVLVYVEGDGPPLTTGHAALIEQRGLQFEPRLLVVPVGTVVDFKNADTEFHHVYSRSGRNSFEIPEYGPTKTGQSLPLLEPGVVDVQCNIHPDMFAQILVIPNAWYVRAELGPDGTVDFSIPGVSPGEHTVVAWTPDATARTRKVTVDPGQRVDLGQVSLRLKPALRPQIGADGLPITYGDQ